MKISSKGKLTSTIIESNDEIIKRMMKVVAVNLNLTMYSCQKDIEIAVKGLLSDAIKGQPEYSNIIYGELRYEFGLLSAFARLDAILNAIIQSVTVEIKNLKVRGSGFTGGLTINAVRSGYADILSLPESSFLTEKGVQLDWLEWLLLEGDSIIIGDYHFRRVNSPRSRTGGGLMIKGGTWSVPSEFSGTIKNNFITRAIQDIQEPIKKVVKKCLTSI